VDEIDMLFNLFFAIFICTQNIIHSTNLVNYNKATTREINSVESREVPAIKPESKVKILIKRNNEGKTIARLVGAIFLPASLLIALHVLIPKIIVQITLNKGIGIKFNQIKPGAIV
jgi:hypothetical protein